MDICYYGVPFAAVIGLSSAVLADRIPEGQDIHPFCKDSPPQKKIGYLMGLGLPIIFGAAVAHSLSTTPPISGERNRNVTEAICDSVQQEIKRIGDILGIKGINFSLSCK